MVVKQQLSGTAIDTKFGPPYACVFMDQVETEFLELQVYKSLVWFQYVADVFFFEGVLLVLTYHPKVKSLNKILTKNMHLLYKDKKVKKVFTLKPMISFCSARKLSSYLVRAKIFPIERTFRFKNCDSKRCEVCKNVNETSTFTGTVTR